MHAQVVSKHVAPGELEGVQLNVVDYAGIRYDTLDQRNAKLN